MMAPNSADDDEEDGEGGDGAAKAEYTAEEWAAWEEEEAKRSVKVQSREIGTVGTYLLLQYVLGR